MRIVFDLDETICVHKNRDYENADPVERTIARMKQLRSDNPDCEIVIHTARGMKSCGGDAQLADAKNREVTEAWLARNGVPYDELVFGKPFADAYIDDKAVTLDDWQSFGYSKMHGYSGKPVHAIARIVVKDDPTGAQRDWYAEADRICVRSVFRPRVISWSFGRLFIRRVSGRPLCEMDRYDFRRYVPLAYAAVREMSCKLYSEPNDICAYNQLVAKRGAAAGMDGSRVKRLLTDINRLKGVLRQRTFSHGDFTTMNLLGDGNKLFAIDPSYKPSFSTALLDAAKFRASLRGLEATLEGTTREYDNELKWWDSLWLGEELEAIKVLERTLLVRVAGLARAKSDDRVADILLELEATCK